MDKIRIYCKQCGKEFKDKYPHRISKFCSQKCYGLFKTGKPTWNTGTVGMMPIPWNKNLTKEDDERMKRTAKKQSEIRNKLIKEGKIKVWNKGKKIDKILYPTFGMKGKKHTLKAIKKMSEKAKLRIGENAPNWKGGKSSEPYSLEFNDKFKRVIRKRDNQICMMCGIHREKLNRALDIHHINYDKGCNIPQNCISLCKRCHIGIVHSDKEKLNYWTKFFQSLLTERYGYQYSENGEIILNLNIEENEI